MPGSLKTWDQSWDPQVGKASKEQAQKMLADIKAQQAKDPEAKIAILYAANGDQTQALNKKNDANNGAGSPGYDANTIDGAGQAKVFKALIDLINSDPELKDEQKKKIRILPITTCKQAGADSDDNGITANQNAVTEAQLKTDLTNIQSHIDKGWQVIAPPRFESQNGVLKRPDQVDPNNQFGFGGGVAKAFTNAKLPDQDKTRNDIIQEGLNTIQAKVAQQQQPAKKTPITVEPAGNNPQSSKLFNEIIKDYNESYAQKHNLPEATVVDGKIHLYFESDEDAVAFLKEQSSKGRECIVRNDKGDILGFSKGGNFFNADGTPSNGKDFGKPMSPQDFKNQQRTAAPVPLGAATNSTTNVVEKITGNLKEMKDAPPAPVQAEIAANANKKKGNDVDPAEPDNFPPIPPNNS